MEQPPPPPWFAPKDRKSLGPPLMDPDVIEVPPPVHLPSKPRKQKQVALSEVIDVDKYEDFSKGHFVADIKGKGKAVLVQSSTHNDLGAEENLASMSKDKVPMGCPPEFDAWFDDMPYTDGPIHHYDEDIMDYDMYESLQSYFDSIDIPAGIEVPLPLLSHSAKQKTKSKSENNSSNTGHDTKAVVPQVCPSSSQHAAASAGNASNFSDPLPPGSVVPQTDQSKNKSTPVEIQFLKNKDSSQRLPQTYPQAHHIKSGSSFNTLPGSPFGTTLSIAPLAAQSFMGWPQFMEETGFQEDFSPFVDALTNAVDFPEGVPNMPMTEDSSRTPKNVNDFLLKFHQFKRFDTVEDFSDHHYAHSAFSVKQPSKTWAKKIQDEWKMLENNLPDMIYVRVYESRMDLLRAVIIGAEGTPYHDGLFFFDVLFPNHYPNVPPHVYYHSGGLRLNPNLYGSGKVCLSLLGTWSGSKNERWIPGTSTMLQVLVSIQALILNKKPYFNEPGYERWSGQRHGELKSQRYNEDTFILSLRTMIYTMRRPPRHFEDFVFGHFYSRAHDILAACKAYVEGAPVGCVVKGGVQDVDESESSGSENFKQSLPRYLDLLVKEFKLIGVENCDRYMEKRVVMKGVKV